jgi:hypothetical protein
MLLQLFVAELFVIGRSIIFQLVSQRGTGIVLGLGVLIRIPRFVTTTTRRIGQRIARCTSCFLVLVFRSIFFRIRDGFAHISGSRPLRQGVF